MPDRLEQRLRALGAELDFPETPDLAARVLPRVTGARASRRLLPLGGRAMALAVAGLVVLAAAAAAVPPVRDAVRDLLGLGGATVERVPSLPSLPGGLDLGRPVSSAEAGERASFPLRTPHDAALGPPDAVFLRGRPPSAQVTMAYRPARTLPRIEAGPVGLLFSQWRADLDGALVEKFIGPETGTRRVLVRHARGFWIRGPHSFAYRNGGGQVRIEERRLAANTLLWRDGPLLLRIESRLGLRRTLAIAESVR